MAASRRKDSRAAFHRGSSRASKSRCCFSCADFSAFSASPSRFANVLSTNRASAEIVVGFCNYSARNFSSALLISAGLLADPYCSLQASQARESSRYFRAIGLYLSIQDKLVLGCDKVNVSSRVLASLNRPSWTSVNPNKNKANGFAG